MTQPADHRPTPVNEQQAREAIRRGLLLGVFSLAVLLALTGVLARTPMGGGVLDDLRDRARPSLLLGAVFSTSLAYGFMALRWRALLPPGWRLPVRGLTAVLSTGLLLNYAVPGPVGEVGAAWLLRRRYGVPTSDALAAGVTARLLGLATAACLAAVFGVAGELSIPPDYQGLVTIGATGVGLGGAILGFVAARPVWWRALSAATIGRWRGPGSKLAGGLHRGVVALSDALSQVLKRGPLAYLRAIMWSTCGHLAVIGGILLATWSLGAQPSIAGLAFTYAASTAGVVALFALPGSQLGWDAMFFGLLVGTAGLDVPDALAVALFVRLQQLLIMVAGAGASTWLLRSPGIHTQG